MTTHDQRNEDTDNATENEADPSEAGSEVQNTLTAEAVFGPVVQAASIGTVAVHQVHHHHPAAGRPMPRQLPAVPPGFIGRSAELDQLTAALNPAAGVLMVSAIAGAGGIGKTWLALAWAHHHIDRFPDGQLFVDLHGFSPTREPVAPAAAVRGFLDALGVEPGRIPIALDDQAKLYRSLVADKRMLIVLDNAATTEQVIPLLPGNPSCTVLVTGRRRLASLIDRHGARHLTLGILTGDEARALLAERLGSERLSAESEAVKELVAMCGGHPLALSIIARTAAAHRGAPLAEVAAELRELGLELLDHETDPAASLPTVLSWSLQHLTEGQRNLFALLGVTPGPDTTLHAVSALTGLSPNVARRGLSALEESSLLDRRPGGRYAMHDLVRAYATTTAHTTLPAVVREAALGRVMDFHLHTARAADRVLHPHRPLVPLDPPAPGVHPYPVSDTAAATAWLEAEHPTLVATQRAAAALGRHYLVWHLAWALATFHLRRGHLRDGLAVWRAAVDAATHLSDPTTLIRAHRFLGYACSRLGLHEQAISHLGQALTRAAGCHDRTEQAHTHHALAIAWELRGDDTRALNHAHHALHYIRAHNQPVWEADALNQVGWYAARLGEYDTARAHCHAALTLHRQHHNTHGEAAALDSLGYVAHHSGDHHQALAHYNQALTLLRTLGNTYQIADTLESVGDLQRSLGQHVQARATWQEALKLCHDQSRDTDAARVQLKVDDLDRAGDQPPQDTKAAT